MPRTWWRSRPGQSCRRDRRRGGNLTSLSAAQRGQDLLGQTVVVIGGSAGIGLETARLARGEGAELIITARNPERLERVGRELGASVAAFDASDFDTARGVLRRRCSKPIDHVLLTGPGPYYAPLAELDLEEARRDVDTHLMLPILDRSAARRAKFVRAGRCSS